jgi:PKD repeat protein
VNATDPAPGGSKLDTYRWYTFTTKASDGGGDGTLPPENKKPVADLSAGESYQGFVNATILFNGSRSSDPDGTITTWFWVFGDNTSGTGKTVNHTFLKTGTYTVTLTVTDDDGATHTDTTTCVITQPNRRPTAPIITGPLNGTKNTLYTYSVSSTDADNDTIRYSITWGDETSYVNISTFLPSGTPFMCTHSWTTAGRYVVTIRVTDDHNLSSSKITVYIDAKQTGNIGYLFDDDSDGIYDAFYSDASKQITTVQNQDGSYNIDSDGDGEWDYTFGTTNELAEYQKPPPDIQLFFIIGAIVLVSIWAILISLWMRKTKEHN